MTRPSMPRPEYPRPQFVRREWLNLNGWWEFCFDDTDQGRSRGWHDGRPLTQQLRVPFPYQSELSGINDKGIHEVVWYARSFEVPPEWRDRDLLLHFGAVDYLTHVWVNGREVGHNRGGHVPFFFDIAPFLRDGENRISIRVEDRQDPNQPRGKQSSTGIPHGIDYYCTTGIWQTVWLEPAPPIRIDSLRITPTGPDILELCIHLHAPSTGWDLEVEAWDGDARAARAAMETAGAVARIPLAIPKAKPWRPDSPHLYELRIRLRDRDRLLDEVISYAGLRTLRLQDGRFLLNDEPIPLLMVLDQGYWPQSCLAAPSDDALRADVAWTKAFGFNGARKHQKFEDPRWLYWCDRLGLLVWTEMPNARAWSLEAEERLLAEWERGVLRDYNHPCVIAWVPLNESMGFPGLAEGHPGEYAFVERIVAATRRLDPGRPIVDNDGWEHTDVTDICAIHDYTPTAAGLRERYQETLRGGPLPPTVWYRDKPLFLPGSQYRGQPVVLSEVGGFLALPEETPPGKRDRLYQFYPAYRSADELLAKYEDLMHGLADLPFLAGFCYTQLTDIEQEVNGLLTYSRRPKVDPERVAAIHRRLWPRVR
jgi:beta-galactosidase/beta-glucuronidase